MSKPPFSPKKALRTIQTSQKIEGYKPTKNKSLKEKARKIITQK